MAKSLVIQVSEDESEWADPSERGPVTDRIF